MYGPGGIAFFVFFQFLTSAVHNSVVYAVLNVMRKKNVWYYLHFFVPLRDIHEEKKVLKEVQNGMKNVKN